MMKVIFSLILCLLSFLSWAQLKETGGTTAGAIPENIHNKAAVKDQIDEGKYVPINGIEQWVTIKGNRSKPVILFVHGGPGSVMSPYCDNMYTGWKEDYVLVNWDQRGAGRTFGRNAPDEVDENYWIEHKLTLDQIVNDGIALTEYLTNSLGKQKVILIGTSWGSIVGVKMALARPDLFTVYLGHAQFVNFNSNLDYAYRKVVEMAMQSEDTVSLKKLNALGNPPYSDARSVGQMIRIVKMFEQQNAVPAPSNWWDPAPEYNNEVDNKNRFNGDDYSFLYFAGHEKLGIEPMAKGVDFSRDAIKFEIPVYLIQGEQDILTASNLNKPYFDKISAPDKAYYLLPNTAHGHNQSVVDTQYQILRKKLK